MDNIKNLDTEQVNPRTKDFSKLITKEMITKINYEDSLITQLVLEKQNKIAKLIELSYFQLKNTNGRIVYIGAGTSGRIGILDASEIYPTFGVENRIIGIIAGGKEALYIPREGSEDDEESAVKDLQEIKFSKNDVLIGISASGRTPYVLAALKYAKNLKAHTGLICNSKNSLGSLIADVTVDILTGAEVICGSTRMKAGTSQKLVCNMISSIVMTKLGYVEGNYMINLVPTNLKLEQRCINIIQQLTNADLQLIKKVFKETKNVKLSLIMIEKNISLEEAKKIYKELYGR